MLSGERSEGEQTKKERSTLGWLGLLQARNLVEITALVEEGRRRRTQNQPRELITLFIFFSLTPFRGALIRAIGGSYHEHQPRWSAAARVVLCKASPTSEAGPAPYTVRHTANDPR